MLFNSRRLGYIEVISIHPARATFVANTCRCTQRAIRHRSRDRSASRAGRTRRGSNLRSTRATTWPSSMLSALGETRCVAILAVTSAVVSFSVGAVCRSSTISSEKPTINIYQSITEHGVVSDIQRLPVFYVLFVDVCFDLFVSFKSRPADSVRRGRWPPSI